MRVRHIKRGMVGAWAAAVILATLAASPAFAEARCETCTPWWHLNVDSAPAVLQPGQAKDEVQEITVSATGGTFELRTETPAFATHTFPWDATHQQLQEGLQEMFGAGNIEVPSGQGNETGSEPYKVVFKGEFADRSLERMSIESSLTGGRKEATVTAPVEGRSDAMLILTAANMGGADLTGPVTVSAKLPAGLTAVAIKGTGGFAGFTELECTLGSLSCTYPETTFPYEQLQLIIPVNINSGAKSGEVVELAVGGGNALPARTARSMTVGNIDPAFGVENYEMTPEEEGGTTSTQAGGHPFQLTTTLMLNQRVLENPLRSQYKPEPAEMGKDLNFKLPPGLIGNPTPFPQCRLPQFAKSSNYINECPDDTAIGVAAVTISVPGIFTFTTVAVPLFNLTPSTGEPARFGFEAVGTPVYLDTSVRTGGDYGVTVKVTNITQAAVFVASRVTFWGVPGDPRHDQARGWSCVADDLWSFFGNVPPCTPEGQHNPPPLLELPTSCTGPLQTTVEADSWQAEGAFGSFTPTMPLPSLDGCNRLPFSPSISVSPDGQAASSPSGLTVGIHVPQEVSLDAEGLGEADVRNTTVTLPAGVALNPAAADGLLSCSEAQIALDVHAPPNCPEAAKVGTVEIKSPLLPNALTGAVYLAAQTTNPFGSLVAMYLVAEDPVSGTLIKVAGEVKLDPVTGRIVSTFDHTPQLPFEDLKLHFFGGSRAPLGTPAACGAYTTATSIAPWSGNAPATPSSTFDITSGPNGSACASPSPFSPSLTAGTTSIQAGGFSPFTMTVSRNDGQQNIQQIQLHMPSGLSGLLTGVELCGEAQADDGMCGPNSLIGETTVSVGLGGDPFSVTGGKVYITGPYEGAPFGLSIVVPAKAGPYDLGTVVVRGRIEVDPTTSALTVTTNSPSQGYAIPHILDGIPLEIKHVNFVTTRPEFTFNPTNCDPMGVTGSISSVEGSSSAVSVPFQVTNCAVLGFKPGFKVATSGKTSRANGASLDVRLTYPKAAFGGQANIKSVKVDLPKQLPSRLTTLQKACTSAQFQADPAGCPAASKVGHATAITPLIPVPLTGPAYFVSYGGAKFPELVVVLQGYGVTLDLHGETFINKAGITSSTFHTVPDAPVGSFELTLPQGKYSALAANGNLCKTKLKMPTLFDAQNGMVIKQSTPISVTGCPKKAHETTKSRKHHKGKTHKKKK